ncbi:MAG: molybdopterin molybdenumtransferase MoeA, partial [Candidatus Zixiibacteriota bacterium]
MPESPYPMVPVSEALAIVLEQALTLSKQVVSLRNCLGLVLAEDIVAREPQPPFPASVKDGFAVVAADGPGDYPVIGEVTAGHPADFRVRPGAVAYITTGAPVPEGADAVVMVEDTEPILRDGQRWVRIKRPVKPGDDIRPVGVDVEAGQRILTAGERLGPAEIGLLATVGVTSVIVHPRPRVAVLSTGDEVVEPDQQPGPGQIRDSNRTMLLTAVQAAGGEPVDLGIAGDSQ